MAANKTAKAKATAWPAAPVKADAKAIASAYAEVRSTLAKDPLFAKDAPRFGVSLTELDARMTRPPARLDDGDALYTWLDGADQYRYAGVRVLVEAMGGGKATRLKGRVIVPEMATRVATGDVTIDGDLILDSHAMVIVLGKLTVTGAIVGASYDYTMLAAREIACGAGLTYGELIALDRIAVKGDFYFGGNDYSSRAPRFESRVLVDFERGNFFTQAKTKTRITKWDFPAAAKALGVGTDGALADAFRAKLVGLEK